MFLCKIHLYTFHSRASTLENSTAFMTVDHTTCCAPVKKKAVDIPAGEPKKKKARKTSVDPDYDPLKDREETDSPQPSTSGYKPPVQQNIVKPLEIKTVTCVQNNVNPNNIIKVGNTTFKPRTPTLNQARPRVQVVTAGTINVGKYLKLTIS